MQIDGRLSTVACSKADGWLLLLLLLCSNISKHDISNILEKMQGRYREQAYNERDLKCKAGWPGQK